MDLLSMPNGSEELLRKHAAAKRGDAYWYLRGEHSSIAFTAGPFMTLLMTAITWFCVNAAVGLFTHNPSDWQDIYSPVGGVIASLVGVVFGLLTLGCLLGVLSSGKEYFDLVTGKKYLHRRTEEEEATLQDKLVLDAVELRRQVDIYNTLFRELVCQEGMDAAGLPTDIDVVRGRLVAQALHDDLAPKLLQLDALIKRREHQSSGQTVDLAALQEVLGDRHRDVLAELKTQQEMGGDAAAHMLHSVILNDETNVELGDASAFARKLAAKRGQQAQ